MTEFYSWLEIIRKVLFNVKLVENNLEILYDLHNIKLKQ